MLESTSSYKDVNCGVPQGSNLGPLLFIIYINDMNKAVKHAIVYHFADDTSLVISDKNTKTIRKLMNKDLSHLFDWFCANRLSINVDKTEFILFKPNNKVTDRLTLRFNCKTIYESFKVRYFGIILDHRLTWKHHIHELSKKLCKTIGVIRRLKQNCVPQKALITV